MGHGDTGIMTLYFWKSLKKLSDLLRFSGRKFDPAFCHFARCRNFHIWPTPHPHPTPKITSNSENWKYNNDWRLVFILLGLVKSAISVKFHFHNRRQNGPAAHFDSRYFFFIVSTHFIQLFWLRFNSYLSLVFFQTHTKSGKHESKSLKTLPWSKKASEKNGQKWQSWPMFSESYKLQHYIFFN